MKLYISILLAFVTALLLAAAGTNIVVNPYDVFAIERIPGLSAKKPELNRHLRFAKTAQYPRIAPVALLLGNSRVAVGFDPEASVWPADLRPVYNMGLPGYGLEVGGQVAAQAIGSHVPRRLYVGLDFVDFLLDEEAWRSTSAPARVGFAPLHPSPSDWADMVLSLAALGDSLATVLAQHAPDFVNVSEAGWVDEGQYRRLVRTDGHHTLFRQALNSTLPRYAGRGARVRWPSPGANPELLALERLVALAREEGIEVVLFTYPYHAWMLTGLEALGLFPALADWKVMLAEWTEARGLPLWDFMHFSPITTEPVPPPGERRTTMRWYWEGGHFKAALGAVMASHMLAQSPSPDLTALRLTSALAGEALQSLQAGHAAYVAANPDAVVAIDTVMARIDGNADEPPG